ncbi:ATP-binding protein [Curtanaerobium respiraculi]|jgi:MoxR-like ATPase|uniref:ATP-binding protein n=1 Tax=Curtanaerobium respiraculi TaxID=2949669 RepID=UPI0024B36302|nr:ATP-binding protein [Curtanaerobium respiraculi]
MKALSPEIRSMMEALVIDGDEGKAMLEAYRLAVKGAKEDGPNKGFFGDIVRAYGANGGVRADDSLPVEVSSLVYVEHPEEVFDESRYYVTDQARRIVEQVHSMRASAPKLRALGLSARNTTLFYGLPGTGKTELARYIAYKEGLPLVYMNMSNAVDSLMGRTAKNISEVFRYSHKGSCVLMIDELDCVANVRAAAVRAADGELNRTTITFMQEIDRLPSGVVLLAATNRDDMLDPALLRRFVQVEYIERLPEQAARGMIRNWVHGVEQRTEDGVKFSEREIESLMADYESDSSITQATVVQRATSLLAQKLREVPKFRTERERRHLRTFRVIDPEDNTDVTRDKGRWREYVEREEWAQPLRFSTEPEGFLLDDSGRLRLASRNSFVIAPRERFEILLSRYSKD